MPGYVTLDYAWGMLLKTLLGGMFLYTMPKCVTLDYAGERYFGLCQSSVTLDYAVSILLTSMSGCINIRIWWEVFTLD